MLQTKKVTVDRVISFAGYFQVVLGVVKKLALPPW